MSCVQRVIGGMAVWWFLAAATSAQTLQNLSAVELLERCEPPLEYEIGEDLEFEIPVGSGIHLQCDENAHGIQDYLVVFADDGQVWVCARDRDGYFFSRSSAFFRKSRAMVYQVGGTACATRVEWEVDGDRVLGSACLSDDPRRNRETLDWAWEEDSGAAIFTVNGRAFEAPALSEVERVTGFVKLWSEVKFNFAFFDQVPHLDWDAVLAETLPLVQNAASTEEYYRVLQRCLARLNDGHTNAWGPGLGRGTGCHPPFSIRYDAKGEPRVSTVATSFAIPSEPRRSEVRASGVRPGDRLTHRNGEPFVDYVKREIAPYVCASTPHARRLELADRSLQGPFHEEVTFTFERDGGSFDARFTLSRYDLPAEAGQYGFVVQDLDQGLLYVNLPSFGDAGIVSQFESVLDRVRACRGLILDVRKNGGGNSRNGYDIIRHLTDTTLLGSAWRTRMYRPAFRAWGHEEEWYEGSPSKIQPAGDPYLGPIAVLIGTETFSAAEDFVVALHATERATVIGSPTGGSTGQPLRVTLPGGGGARICTKRDTYPDGRDFVGVGIIPDVEVHATPDDLRASRDVALQAAVEFLERESKRVP